MTSDTAPHRARGALILADGPAPTRALLDEAWPGWAAGIGLVVAADGGARHGATLGVRVDRWVGDGDSIDEADLAALTASGVPIERVSVDKDESDAELALSAALADGVDSVVVLGGLGGARIDHALSNLGLLDHPALGGRPACLYDEHGARISLLVAPDATGRPVARDLRGRAGDLVSLLPDGGTAHGVTTSGLRYPLAAEPLVLGRSRGVSNVRTAQVARIALESGRLLVIESPANLRA
jgi:thiamine pyrophosphokinase